MAIEEWVGGLRTLLDRIRLSKTKYLGSIIYNRLLHAQNPTRTRLNPTSQRREALQLFSARVDFNGIHLVREDQPRHRALSEEVAVQSLPIDVCGSGAPVQTTAGKIQLPYIIAVGVTAGMAARADAATGIREDDRIAGFESRDAGANFSDYTVILY